MFKEKFIWQLEILNKTWYKEFETHKDMAIDSLYRINHIHLYLNSLGIQNYHFIS